MKNIINVIVALVFIGIIISLTLFAVKKQKHKDAMELSSKQQIFIIGNEKEGKVIKEAIESLSPAHDYVSSATKYYKSGDYDKAIQACDRAINIAHQDQDLVATMLAHFRKLDIYEATKKYDLAIKEIDWLIDGHVNEQAKKELLERKQKLQELLNSQAK